MDEIELNDLPDHDIIIDGISSSTCSLKLKHSDNHCEAAIDEENYTQVVGEVKASGRSDSVENIVKLATTVRAPLHKLERQMTIAGISGIRAMNTMMAAQPAVRQSSLNIDLKISSFKDGRGHGTTRAKR